MNKIKRVSWFFRIIFQIIFIGFPLLLAYSWMTNPEEFVLFNGIINGSFIPKGYLATADHPSQIMHVMSVSERLCGFLVCMIPMAIDLFIVYSLIKLFRLYERGEIFSINNVRYMRNIGYGLLAGEFIDPIFQSLMGIVLTIHNPPGHRFFSIGWGSTNAGIILMALMIILISWVMAEGCKLREDQQLTI